MFIPVGDTPNPRNFTPWVTWALIGINVAAYLLISLPLSLQGVDPGDPALREFLRHLAPTLPAGVSLSQVLSQLSAYDLYVFTHGYKPGAPQIIDLIASMFLHAGFWHLAGNMLFLWIYGDNVEHRLGRAGYLSAYLATGATATLCFAFFAGPSMTPLVGASGAISGVLGLYFLLFPRNRIKVFVLLFPFFMDVILLPARLVLGFFILIDNLLPFLVGAASGVAYGAHIGGFFAGLLLAAVGERLAWSWPGSDNLRKPAKAARHGKAPAPEGSPARLEVLRTALAGGERPQALKALAGLDRDAMAALTPGECVTLASWLEEGGHPAASSRILRRCISSHAGTGELAEVYLALGLMRLRQGQPTAAYQHLLDVFEHAPAPATAAKARDALERIDMYRRKH